jgi:hypothetical protein
MMKQARNRTTPSGATPAAERLLPVQADQAVSRELDRLTDAVPSTTVGGGGTAASAAANAAGRPLRLAPGFAARALVLGITLAGWTTSVGAVDADCQAAFEHLDTNHDRVVDQSEFATNKVAVIYRAAARPVSRVGQDVEVIRFERTHLSRRAFDELDLDRNGALDPHEIANAPMFQFDWWNRSGDPVLDWPEFLVGCQELER